MRTGTAALTNFSSFCRTAAIAGLSPKTTSSGGRPPTDSDQSVLEAVADIDFLVSLSRILRGGSREKAFRGNVLHVMRQIFRLEDRYGWFHLDSAEELVCLYISITWTTLGGQERISVQALKVMTKVKMFSL